MLGLTSSCCALREQRACGRSRARAASASSASTPLVSGPQPACVGPACARVALCTELTQRAVLPGYSDLARAHPAFSAGDVEPGRHRRR
eukprot:1015313-Rhodomonas_salina.1